MTDFIRNRVLIWLLSFLFIGAYAQQPTHSAGSKNESIDLSNWVDILIFIVFPVVIIFIYFLWRRMVRKDRERSEGEVD